MSQSKLINSGSYGCVFYPKIPCDKDKNKNKKKTISKKKQATKLIILDESFGTEFKINKTIQKINNYDKWTAIWDEKCLSPKYNKLKQISEINKLKEPRYAKNYASSSISSPSSKPTAFASKLLNSLGFDTPEFFVDASVLKSIFAPLLSLLI